MDAGIVSVILIALIYVTARRFEQRKKRFAGIKLRERVAELVFAAAEHAKEDQSGLSTLYDMPTEVLVKAGR